MSLPRSARLDVSLKLIEMGCDELSIGDTIGVGVPSQVDELVPLLAARIPLDRIAMHFHDTRGTALANVYAALLNGISKFDSSSGGLGGCPYAPGATGNVGTEDVLYMLERMGIETGVDIAKVRAASRFIAGVVDHALTSKAYQAMEAADAAPIS
jgi:isopropylmalate/homocitrate/citramalate synthase